MHPSTRKLAALAAVVLALLYAGEARAEIHGITGPAFNLTAAPGKIDTPDGNSILIWGFAADVGPDGVAGSADDGTVQYPAPTLLVNQGDVVTVALTNGLSQVADSTGGLHDVNVSIIFPGQTGVSATGGVQGRIAVEAAPGGTVTYSFTASRPGTYMYHSGTRPDLQVEMGLVGALIVRPTGFSAVPPDPVHGPANPATRAYEHVDSAYHDEYLFLLTEMDPRFHRLVELGRVDQIDTNDFSPVYWFVNGRCSPDTFFPAFAEWLPNQPYNSLPIMHPGQKILQRVVGGGRDSHPFHPHGNHQRIIATDGRLLSSGDPAVTGADLAYGVFTLASSPGQTIDAIYEWTGAKLAWDIYGHPPDDVDAEPTGDFPAGVGDVDHNGNGILDVTPLEPNEYAPDHGKPFPVVLPGKLDLGFGGFWSGSPFLGALGALPPGEGGLNPGGGFTFMWHSHTEKEIVNNGIFPGGMMSMLVVLPWPQPQP